jgi:HlyD family secretion protein
MRSRQAWPGVVAAFGLGLAGASPGDAAAQESAAVREVHALARIEPAGGTVTVGARPGVRVDAVLVHVGDDLKAGQPLAVLEGQEAARLQVAQAEAQKRRADEQKARQRARLTLERTREDRVQKVRLETLEDIHATLDKRAKAIVAARPLIEKMPGVTPKDLFELDVALDRMKVDAARAALELEQAKADQASLAPRRALEDKELADGGPADDLLLSQIELARANLDLTTVKAPAAGRVLDVIAHSGEVSAGPLMIVADVSSMVATAEVDQSDVPAIEPGAAAEVTVVDRKVAGKVTRVSRVVGKNLLASPDPRMPQDLRVVQVTIQLEQPEPAARYVNLQVDAAIRTRPAGPR